MRGMMRYLLVIVAYFIMRRRSGCSKTAGPAYRQQRFARAGTYWWRNGRCRHRHNYPAGNAAILPNNIRNRSPLPTAAARGDRLDQHHAVSVNSIGDRLTGHGTRAALDQLGG